MNKVNLTQDQIQIKWISDFIWNIADDRLRNEYVRRKYRDVLLSFTALRRLDVVLESTKDVVLIPKLPAPKEEGLSKGVFDAIDMGS